MQDDEKIKDEKNIGTTLALYPCPVIVVGAKVGNCGKMNCVYTSLRRDCQGLVPYLKRRKIMANKILVAVFSASGVTKRVGEEIAKIAGADFYEIVPKEIYTSADLDWMNKKSRSSIEMNDSSARPEINGKVADMASYDTVIVGFPIWWGVAPRIIDTFLESYDFSGKKIIPFCTSGGSGVGRSDTALHKDVSGDVKWAKGRQINRANESEIRRFLDEVL